MASSLDAHLKAHSQRVSDYLTLQLDGFTSPVADAMRYALTGGKALRAALVYESAGLYGLTPDMASPAAGAIECVHAYSLAHDDLPAMDDDDLRRGKPTLHRQWNEAVAILAGDALQAQAFRLVLETQVAPLHRAELAHGLAVASGIAGMVGGQEADIAAETSAEPLTLDEITALQRGKTGALIRWSAAAGAVMMGKDPEPLLRYGDAIGLAFQIADDILDETGDEADAGKALRKDADAGKATFVSLLGLEGAQARAKSLADSAVAELEQFGPEADILRDIAYFTVNRRK